MTIANLWKDGEPTDFMNRVMFIIALLLGLSGYVIEFINSL